MIRRFYILVVTTLFVVYSPNSFSQITSVKKPEFEALAKKMLKALKKINQDKFLECFMSREEYDALHKASGEKIEADEADVAYMKAARRYADNFFLFAKKNDADNFDWTEMKLDSLKYKVIKTKSGISSTDIYLYTSIMDQPYKITLNEVVKVGELPWKIKDDCWMQEELTLGERLRIRAEIEAKHADINKTVLTLLRSLRNNKRDDLIASAGTQADQLAIIDNFSTPGTTKEQTVQLRDQMRAVAGENFKKKLAETGLMFDKSIALVKEKKALLAEATIFWNEPVISTQMGMEIADVGGYIRDHSVYFTFHFNLVKVNGQWIINHPSPISFVAQGSSIATTINDIIATDKYYKKL